MRKDRNNRKDQRKERIYRGQKKHMKANQQDFEIIKRNQINVLFVNNF